MMILLLLLLMMMMMMLSTFNEGFGSGTCHNSGYLETTNSLWFGSPAHTEIRDKGWYEVHLEGGSGGIRKNNHNDESRWYLFTARSGILQHVTTCSVGHAGGHNRSRLWESTFSWKKLDQNHKTNNTFFTRSSVLWRIVWFIFWTASIR